MEKPEFYNVEEQTKYTISISRPEGIDDLTDCFISHEELETLIGRRVYLHSKKKGKYTLGAVVSAELKKWAEKLDASGKKTFPIEDEDLLNVLKSGYLSDYMSDSTYCRHGDRIGYSRRYKRVKKKATQKDVRRFWTYVFPYAFRHKFDCYPPNTSLYDRHLPMFRAYKKILGWKNCVKYMDVDNRKFYRQIWDNPEEYVK